jgi:hypothetical protein
MKKSKLLIIGVAVLVVVLVGIGAYFFLIPSLVPGMSAGSKPNGDKKISSIEQITPVAKEDISVPEDVTKICSAKYWLEKDASGNLKDCKEYSQDMVCAYHRETKDKVSSVVNRQYATECDACRSFGEEGVTEVDGVTYELLGFKTGECFQGVYKTNF